MAANELETTTETEEDVKDDALEVEIVDSLDDTEVKAEEDDLEAKDDEETEAKADETDAETADVEEVEVKDNDVEEVLSELVETKEVEVDEMRVKRLTELGIDPDTVTDDQFYCAETKSMATEVHDDCRGGCAPENDLPGLFDVEVMASKAYGGEIVRSGYASTERLFFVDIKREDGKFIEAAYADNGEALGWNLLDSELIEEKSGEAVEAITIVEAEEIALKEFPGTSLGVQTAIFEGVDSYVVEIDTTDGKSIDAYVALDGTFAGSDEYVYNEEADTKVAMPGSAPAAAAPAAAAAPGKDDTMKLVEMIGGVTDAATLGKVVTAIGEDVDAVPDEIKMAIVKKATELKAVDVLPEAWKKPAAAPAAAPAPAKAPMPDKKPMDDEKSLEEDVEEKTISAVVDGETDEEFAARIAEFQAMSTTQESE